MEPEIVEVKMANCLGYTAIGERYYAAQMYRVQGLNGECQKNLFPSLLLSFFILI